MTVELAPDVLDAIADRLVDRIADRLLERLAVEASGGTAASGRELLTSAEVAQRFGVARSWVYEHAEELGVVRLGGGPRARLRFDAQHVADALRAPRKSQPPTRPKPASPRPRKSASRTQLLPIRGERG